MQSLLLFTIGLSIPEACYGYIVDRVSVRRGGVSRRDNITLAAPIVAVPSQHWEGADGLWSTFTIRIGTPVSTYRILPATSWQETWVIYGAALNVCNTSVGVPSTCQESRGGVFEDKKSSTWEKGDQFQLGLNQELGMQGVGQYGFDTVGLGYTNSTGPTMKHQIISEIVSDDWWLGMLGLGFQPTNFTSYADPQPSFSSSLFAAGLIASHSWSYTAGAVYRLKGIFGSLVFGGYDEAKFTPNNVGFTMTQDNLRDLVVTVRSINATTSQGKTSLMSMPQFAFIDSSVPELWLPISVCQAFATAFNLTYDNTTDLYLTNAAAHANLLTLNPNITLTLANQKTGGPTVDIVLPYAAFDLNVSAPTLANRSSYYFPIRRGKDESQYVLGRTFLQEAYVTAHYESRTFNVSQAVFSDTVREHIIALPPVLWSPSVGDANTTTAATTTATPAKHSLSKGAIAGIVIGVLALLVLVFLLLLFLRRRKAQKANLVAHFSELDAYDHHKTHQDQAGEVDGHDARFEKFGNPIMIPQELEAAPVPGRPHGGTIEIGEVEGGLSAVSEDREGEGLEGGTRSGGTEKRLERGFGSSNGRRTTSGMGTRTFVMVSSPTASPGSSPTSPVRRNSKFEEHL